MIKRKWNYKVWFQILCVLSLGIGTHISSSVQGRMEEKKFDVEWDYPFGGTNSEYPRSAIQSTDGGFLLVGKTGSFGTANSTHSDAWVIKTDANGQLEWNRTFGSSSSWDEGDWIFETADGGYFLVGYSEDDSNENPWFMKLDTSGQQEWNSSLEVSSFDVAFLNTVLQTTDGGFLVTLNAVDSGIGSRFLIKLDATGVQQWNSTLGVGIPMFFDQMIHTLDGGFLLVGGIGELSFNLFLLKLDAAGTAEWNTSFGGHEGDVGTSVIQIADGSFVISGTTTSYAFSSTDFWLVKTDSSGQLLWNTTFGGLFIQGSSTLIQTTDGGYLLAGITEDISDNVDIWLVKTTATGAHVWNTTFRGSANDWPVSVFQAAETDFVVAGSTKSFGAGEEDMWLFKFSVSDKSTGIPGFVFSLVLFSCLVVLLVTRKRRP